MGNWNFRRQNQGEGGLLYSTWPVSLSEPSWQASFNSLCGPPNTSIRRDLQSFIYGKNPAHLSLLFLLSTHTNSHTYQVDPGPPICIVITTKLLWPPHQLPDIVQMLKSSGDPSQKHEPLEGKALPTNASTDDVRASGMQIAAAFSDNMRVF